METAATSLRFVVIGAGRLGAGLALALRKRGADLLGYTANSPAGRARAETWLGGRATTDPDLLVSGAPQLYVVAVPDGAISEVAGQLAELIRHAAGATAPFVAHTSGATSVNVLRPCEEAGASTLVFHPLQTFSEPVTGSERFAGAAVAVTPSDTQDGAPALAFGFALAEALGAYPFLLPDHKRSLYHAAASLACNYLVTLEHHAEQLFVKAGLPADRASSLFLPLVRATLENLAEQGSVEALTGPLSRGDTRTIAGHLAALLAEAPHLLPVYQALGRATLPLIEARGELDRESITAMEELLHSPPSDPA